MNEEELNCLRNMQCDINRLSRLCVELQDKNRLLVEKNLRLWSELIKLYESKPRECYG